MNYMNAHRDAMEEPRDEDNGAQAKKVAIAVPDANEACRVKNAMLKIEHKLNVEIGFGWWKKYVAAAFWGNMSMPVNLAITLLTALTAAQTTTGNMLPHSSSVGISLATLVLSVLNTFFRPHVQMTENIKLMSRWTEIGNTFESVYYSENESFADHKRRLRDYQRIQQEVNAIQNGQSPEHQNFLTDLIHVVVRATVLKSRDKWLDLEHEAPPVAAEVSIA